MDAHFVAAWKRATISAGVTKLNVVDGEIVARHGKSGHELGSNVWIVKYVKWLLGICRNEFPE